MTPNFTIYNDLITAYSDKMNNINYIDSEPDKNASYASEYNYFREHINNDVYNIASKRVLNALVDNFINKSVSEINKIDKLADIYIYVFTNPEAERDKEIILAINVDEEDYQKRSVLWNRLREYLYQTLKDIKNPISRMQARRIYDKMWIEVNSLRHV